jgi:hypothetical protein
VLLLAVRVTTLVLAVRRRAREQRALDRPAHLLELALAGLPLARADWGTAMRAELAAVGGTTERWRFSLGCSRAAVTIRVRQSLVAPGRGGSVARGGMLLAIAGCLALAGYGLFRYPDLRGGVTVWISVALFIVLLAAYTLGCLTLCRGVDAGAARARAHAVVGGLVVGGAWLLLLAPGEVIKQLVFVPLVVALLAPCAVALSAARALGNAGLATAAALWSGMIGGLLVFIVWVTTTYASDGRPYDAQLVRDFHASGAHDLATYAVTDQLGAALGLLMVIPVVALAFGSLVARVSAAHTLDGSTPERIGS